MPTRGTRASSGAGAPHLPAQLPGLPSLSAGLPIQPARKSSFPWTVPLLQRRLIAVAHDPLVLGRRMRRWVSGPNGSLLWGGDRVPPAAVTTVVLAGATSIGTVLADALSGAATVPKSCGGTPRGRGAGGCAVTAPSGCPADPAGSCSGTLASLSGWLTAGRLLRQYSRSSVALRGGELVERPPRDHADDATESTRASSSWST